jgi:hypothetical protein
MIVMAVLPECVEAIIRTITRPIFAHSNPFPRFHIKARASPRHFAPNLAGCDLHPRCGRTIWPATRVVLGNQIALLLVCVWVGICSNTLEEELNTCRAAPNHTTFHKIPQHAECNILPTIILMAPAIRRPVVTVEHAARRPRSGIPRIVVYSLVPPVDA